MKKSLEDILAREEAERESEALAESLEQSGEGEEAEETDEDETNKSPMDRWDEEFQQKYDREDEAGAP